MKPSALRTAFRRSSARTRMSYYLAVSPNENSYGKARAARLRARVGHERIHFLRARVVAQARGSDAHAGGRTSSGRQRLARAARALGRARATPASRRDALHLHGARSRSASL